MIKIGIFGATGYVGLSIINILQMHKYTQISFLHANSYAGKKYNEVFPQISTDLMLDNFEDAILKVKNVDLIFLALPHGLSFEVTKEAKKYGVKVIEMGGDYRLKDHSEYEKWYGIKHTGIEELSEAVYGLPELNRKALSGASIVANPGCYATAATLALLPAINEGLCNLNSLVIDGKSGTSGAGRGASVSNIFCEVNENIKGYKVCEHRHRPEIEQTLGGINGEDVRLTFVPHLIPMTRGILVTIYADLSVKYSEEEITTIYKDYYKGSKFVKISNIPPETKWCNGTNDAYIYLKKDDHNGKLVIMCSIDNLMKGAASQAVQNMNLMFGFSEDEGLKFQANLP